MFERNQMFENHNGGDKVTKHLETFRVFETPREFADKFATLPVEFTRGLIGNGRAWCGASNADEVSAWLADGKPELVGRSDKLLSAFDDIQFNTRKSAIVPAVCGGAPNVGAFLAGSPVAMRQRIKTVSDQAPLRLVADISSSAGIKTETLERRGASILALVRMLAAVRPVELYIGFSTNIHESTTQKKTSAHYEMVRIDTTPLDLARAAFLLADPAAARVALYSTACEAVKAPSTNVSINWGYRDVSLSRRRFADAVSRMFGDGSETAYLAPPFVNDATKDNAEAFIREKLLEYGGTPIADAA